MPHDTPENSNARGGTTVQADQRYHAFDAIRGAAMSFGVVLHGAIAYMAIPMPGLVWPVDERRSSTLIDWLFWWIHGFRIPLFFVVAGFFAVMLHNSRGGFLYLRHRTRRILYPLLLACITILPMIGAVWVYGWLDSGAFTWDQIQHLEFGSDEYSDNAQGLAHLWFLQYLYIYCVVFWFWRLIAARVGGRWRRSDRLQRLARAAFTMPLRPLLFAVPTFALLAVDTDTFVDFKNSYAPTPLELAYYFLFFVIGTWMYTCRDHLEQLIRLSWTYLVASFIVAVPMVLLIERDLGSELSDGWGVGLAALIAVFCWLSIFAWMGLFLRWFDRHQPAVRWLSDASYWVYLIHLPLVVLIQIWLTHLQIPAVAKFLIAVTGAYALCLMTYRGLVRYTAIGTLLNGRRFKPNTRSATPPAMGTPADGLSRQQPPLVRDTPARTR